MIAHALKFRSLPARAGELLAKDLLTTCFSESLHLQVQVLIQDRHPRVADVHNLAPDRGKSPCKRMNLCNRLVHTKIASKTRVRPTLQKLQLLRLFGRPAEDGGRKSGIDMKL